MAGTSGTAGNGKWHAMLHVAPAFVFALAAINAGTPRSVTTSSSCMPTVLSQGPLEADQHLRPERRDKVTKITKTPHIQSTTKNQKQIQGAVLPGDIESPERYLVQDISTGRNSCRAAVSCP
jgi:hypothetical protein